MDRPEKIKVVKFSVKDLNTIAESARGKIVEFVLKDHQNKNYIKNVIDLINKEGANWVGLEMNFLYQQ